MALNTRSRLPDGIERLAITNWENAHQNFVHTFKENASFKLRIPTSDPDRQYQDTTRNFQWLIKYAINNNIQLRALGNGWSFSEVALCDGGLVDTKALRLSFNLGNSFVSPEYLQKGKQAGDLFFAECGISILDLNEKLEQESKPKRAIKASGASNGQSIAGCTSTGTHGSAFNVGAVHDTIVGLHIVVSEDRHVWIEKRSNPVASEEFIAWLGAEAIRDDDAFNAAVVSFGSFGFIHGILLETEPVYLLQQFRTGGIVYNDAFKAAMNHLDFSGIQDRMPVPPVQDGNDLYHFEIIINPQQFEANNPDKGVFIKIMYKIPYRADYPKQQVDDHGFTYGDDLLGVLQTIVDTIGPDLSLLLVPPLVNKLFPLAFNSSLDTIGTIGETFCNTKFRGKVGSAAIGIPASHAGTVLEEIVRRTRIDPFPGGIALRYVKGTGALLGFTRFEKTCIIELDGVDCHLSRTFLEKLWNWLEEVSIPYTLHWGKINFNLNPDRLKKMYGDQNIKRWKACRESLLSVDSRKVFTNAFLVKCGLAD